MVVAVGPDEWQADKAGHDAIVQDRPRSRPRRAEQPPALARSLSRRHLRPQVPVHLHLLRT